jgi:hypothetical protein
VVDVVTLVSVLVVSSSLSLSSSSENFVFDVILVLLLLLLAITIILPQGHLCSSCFICHGPLLETLDCFLGGLLPLHIRLPSSLLLPKPMNLLPPVALVALTGHCCSCGGVIVVRAALLSLLTLDAVALVVVVVTAVVLPVRSGVVCVLCVCC